MRSPVDGTGYKFLACAGFAGKEHSGVGRADLRYARQDLFQGGRGADDLFEHRSLVDFLPQGDVFVVESFFNLLAILDFGPGHIPSHNVSLLISEWAVAEKEPEIPP